MTERDQPSGSKTRGAFLHRHRLWTPIQGAQEAYGMEHHAFVLGGTRTGVEWILDLDAMLNSMPPWLLKEVGAVALRLSNRAERVWREKS